MARVLALTLALVAAQPTVAVPRQRHRAFCTPVYIEGAGTVRICAPARGR